MNKDLSNIKKSIHLLNKGDCIGIPTETVYGLAANAYSDKATSKIFKLKKRPKKVKSLSTRKRGLKKDKGVVGKTKPLNCLKKPYQSL